MAMTQWLPKSRRSGGEFTTQNYTIPAGVDTAYTMLDVTAADFSTPDLSVVADIEVSTDGGQTWRREMSATWIGGPLPPPPPGKTAGFYVAVSGLSVFAGALARVHFTTTGTFRWGLLGELR